MPVFLTVDLEDWFQSENVVHLVRRDVWDDQVLTVERNVDQVLRYLRDGGDAKATFFVLGWVAERLPHVVEDVHRAGHEIASHGYDHEIVEKMAPDAFRADVRRSKELLEGLVSTPVRGYRAPTFSITDWAIDVLREEGYTYDSSYFPNSFPYRYGKLEKYASPDRSHYEIGDGFWEYPLSHLRVGTSRMPWSGGGYFRVFPYPLFRWGIRRVLKETETFNFYIHPWEFERDLPKVEGLEWSLRFRHYNNIARTHGRFQRLLKDFDFTSIGAFHDRIAG